jgi:hypothetical protein
MCGGIEPDLITGWQWRNVKNKLREAGINLKQFISCPSERNDFYRRAVYMSVQDLKNHFNSG